MSRYADPSGTNHLRRESISVNNIGGAAAAVDVTITISKTWDTFWTEINQTDGRDIRVVDPDGTITAYRLATFNLSTRTCVIEVDGYVAPAGQMFQLFLYWNNTAASAQSSTFVGASMKTGYVNSCAPPGRIFVAGHERHRDTKPRNVVSKGADESVYLSVDFGGLLTRRSAPYAGYRDCEEISYASYVVLQADSPVGALIDAAKLRIIGGRYVQVYLTAGTSGTEYTVVVTVVTNEGQTFVKRMWLAVQNVDEQ